MFNITEENTKNTAIRHQVDPVTGLLYLSIVDVIEMLGLSSDPRNYWKTLKNRLKNTQNKLVTKCNQLKMPASDGKMYLTDVTDPDSMLVLIQQLAPERVSEFRRIFRETEAESRKNTPSFSGAVSGLSTDQDEDYELSVDAREEKDFIVVEAMLAGVDPSDISLISTCSILTIKGRRIAPKNIPEDSYLKSELGWGKFSREITLPQEIDIEGIEANFRNGLLEIKLPKIDKTRTRVIKVK